MKPISFNLELDDHQHMMNLCGELDKNLEQIKKQLDIEIKYRGNHFQLIGSEEEMMIGKKILESLFNLSKKGELDLEQVHMTIQEFKNQDYRIKLDEDKPVTFHTRRRDINVRGANQRLYGTALRERDLVFGVGPAGTGKTYLAVAAGVEALDSDLVRRLILVRPAVEAGEKLGFLPGDMIQKIDPYLRPIYDALYEMLGFEHTTRLIDKNIIEVAPLAFMRGRTLNESYVILDEAQNTTKEQMKMFLTRMGYGSRTVVTGDITQIDLEKGQESGLKHAIKIMNNIEEASFIHFNIDDVVRHPLVRKILRAYSESEKRKTKN